MWIFAYGSLISRPAFAYVERRTAYLSGFMRRFWQGSPDHRGVPGKPGRVVTLLPAPAEVTGGCAYRIDPATADAVLAALDEREQAGFVRLQRPVSAEPGGPPFADALVYVAAEDNPHFLGPLPEAEIAGWVERSAGPSGPNVDYVRHLHAALRELGIVDPHVEAIVAALSPAAPLRA
ncbi:MAG: Cation transport protein chaC [Labilithrix sp.]|nr:Cation transport protein chaC [Labilithrix sp.]